MRRLMASAAVSVMFVGLASPSAFAAAREPGLYGPVKATVGVPVTFTSVFVAEKTRNCFTPIETWGDEAGQGVYLGICMIIGERHGYSREVDRFTHTYTEPGTYTVTVRAAGMSTKGGEARPSRATVQGPRVYRQTIVVAPAGDATSAAQ